MAVPRPILIDDTSPNITWSGTWFLDTGSQDTLGIHGQTFNHTLHGTNSNSGFSFKFRGTAVQILGTTIPSQYGNTTGPSWGCYIDNQKVQAKPPSTEDRNHYIFCEVDQVSNGEHEIYLNVTTQGQTFWFDFIQFDPIPEDSYASAVVLVDNLDPAINYGSGWHAFSDTAGSNLTNTQNSTLQLDFIGTAITWMSWVDSRQPHGASSATYSIDGDAPVTFNLPGLPAKTNDDLFNLPSFTRSGLSAGQHSIVVTYLGDNTTTPLVLDYFLIANTTLREGTSIDAGGSHHNSSGVPLGAIIGSVAGGVVLLVLLGLLLVLWRKKKAKQRQRQQQLNRRFSLTSVGYPPTPFIDALSADGSQTTFGAESLYNMSQQHELLSRRDTFAPTISSGPLRLTNPNSSQPSLSDSPTPPPQRRRKSRLRSESGQMEPLVAQHRDSGIRMQAQPQPVVEVPPVYTEG